VTREGARSEGSQAMAVVLSMEEVDRLLRSSRSAEYKQPQRHSDTAETGALPVVQLEENRPLADRGTPNVDGHEKPSSPSEERLWSIQDVAAWCHVPVGTVRRWRFDGGGPPGVRLGKHLRYDPADVRAWWAERKRREAGP
jgi:predicted DNA-binding transcriptional regulator AlpA